MSPNSSEKRVIVVEDDQLLANVLKNKLVNAGIGVTVSNDGAEALEILKTEKFDLLLLDLLLPKKNGFEILEEMSKMEGSFGQTPVLIISNLSRDADIERTKSLGASEYYVKAKLSIEDLVQNVQRYLKK